MSEHFWRDSTSPRLYISLSLSLSLSLVSLSAYLSLQASDREQDWAGLCLFDGEVLSAYELHEKFTEEEENSDPIKSRTRLMTLCACSSGAVPTDFDLWCCLSCQRRLVHFADDDDDDDDVKSRSWPSQA